MKTKESTMRKQQIVTDSWTWAKIKQKNERNHEEVNEDENRETRSEHFPEFTKQELQAAIDSLKKRKSGDTKRIKAEDIKESDDETKEIVRENFERSHQTGKHGPRSVEKSVDKVFF